MKSRAAIALGGLAFTAAPVVAWNGGPSTVADKKGELGQNVSGLAMADDGDIWAVRGDPGQLIRLSHSAEVWREAPRWNRAGVLRYPDGTGNPDAEAIATSGDGGVVYVGAERNNDDPDVARNSVVRYEVGDAPAELIATAEWQLGSIIESDGANRGLEALTWISDTSLTGLRTVAGRPYEPADHPAHRGGLFAVAGETSGAVTLVDLLDGGSVPTVVASFDSGLDAVMDLAWDAERKELWIHCDDTCDGQTALARIRDGRFVVEQVSEAPDGLDGLNSEGLVLLGACGDRTKSALFADDGAAKGHALRSASIDCAATPSLANSKHSLLRWLAVLVVPGGGVLLLVSRRRRRHR